MEDRETRTLVVRIPRDLHERASSFAKATGEPVKELVVAGLRKEVEERIGDKADLREIVDKLSAYTRQQC